MARYLTTPWVRSALAADPEDAMRAQSLIDALPGTVVLDAKSAHGPYQAVYHAGPGSPEARGVGPTVSDAIASALAAH